MKRKVSEGPKSSKTAVKKEGKMTKNDTYAILLDVGSSMSSKTAELLDKDGNDFLLSKQILNWVLSRKIFTDSSDRFSLMFFGSETTTNLNHPGVYTHNEEYDTAKIDWLRVLENEVEVNSKGIGDYIGALFGALESLKIQMESELCKNVTVIIISNFDSMDATELSSESLNALINGFKVIGADIMVIGPDFTMDPKSKAQKAGIDFMKQLVEMVNGQAFSFEETMLDLNHFAPKQPMPRGQPFDLELGRDFSIKVQLYIKSQETSMKFKFGTVSKPLAGTTSSESGYVEVKKVRLYETVEDSNKEISLKYTEIDKATDSQFDDNSKKEAFGGHIPTGKIVRKEDISHGWRYGKTVVPFGEDLTEYIEYPKSKKGKQLQLFCFVKSDDILPQFITSSCRYVLPLAKNDTALKAMSALVTAMLDLDVVAVCRYAYNVTSNPRLALLVPKISKKTKYPVLMHFVCPFSEDFRYFNFNLNSASKEPTDQQSDLINLIMDSMSLYKEGKAERLKKIQNPKHQFQCSQLKQKILYPNSSSKLPDSQLLFAMLSTPNDLVRKASSYINDAKEVFPLERKHTRTPVFKKALKEFGIVGDDLKVKQNGTEVDDPKKENEAEKGDIADT